MVEEEMTKGPEQLREEVIDGGWCVSCGACVELCPYIKAVGDRVAVIHPCGLDDGDCYRVCPRTRTDYDCLAREVAGRDPDPALGPYREILRARSPHAAFSGPAQCGGAATALAAAALEGGSAGAALLTTSDGLYPRWVLARDRGQVIAAAGSKYGVCPGLAGLNRALRLGVERIAVVGRPCQVTALRKMQLFSSVDGREKIGPVLGLFCFWGLDYRFYRVLAEESGIARIQRADIPRNEGLNLDTDRGRLTLTLDETRSFVRRGCHSCFDPTAELADLSIGSVETEPGWCTLVVRTECGAALVDRAADEGILETRPFSEADAAALRAAALGKKRRVLAGEDGGDGGPPPVNNSYLRLAEQTRRRIAGEGE